MEGHGHGHHIKREEKQYKVRTSRVCLHFTKDTLCSL